MSAQSPRVEPLTVVIATMENCPACRRDKPGVIYLKRAGRGIAFVELRREDPADRDSLGRLRITAYPTYVVLRGSAEQYRAHSVYKVIGWLGL